MNTRLKNGSVDWDDLVKGLAKDRRAGKRLHLVCSIEINGIDQSGVSFVERTKTQDISEYGCRLETTVPLERGDIIGIKLMVNGEVIPNQNRHFFEIMWTINNQRGRLVGAKKLQPDNLWKVEFPPSYSSPRRRD